MILGNVLSSIYSLRPKKDIFLLTVGFSPLVFSLFFLFDFSNHSISLSLSRGWVSSPGPWDPYGEHHKQEQMSSMCITSVPKQHPGEAIVWHNFAPFIKSSVQCCLKHMANVPSNTQALINCCSILRVHRMPCCISQVNLNISTKMSSAFQNFAIVFECTNCL